MNETLSDDPEIQILTKMMGTLDFLTVRFSVIAVVLLFIIGVTLLIFSILMLLESWALLLVKLGVSSVPVPMIVSGDLVTVVISAIGAAAIAYAVIDLARSILREELAEERIMDVQHRARDFVTRILSVIIVALAVETFVNEAKYSTVQPEILWQVSTVGGAIAAILIGWGIYLKLSRI